MFASLVGAAATRLFLRCGTKCFVGKLQNHRLGSKKKRLQRSSCESTKVVPILKNKENDLLNAFLGFGALCLHKRPSTPLPPPKKRGGGGEGYNSFHIRRGVRRGIVIPEKGRFEWRRKAPLSSSWSAMAFSKVGDENGGWGERGHGIKEGEGGGSLKMSLGSGPD